MGTKRRTIERLPTEWTEKDMIKPPRDNNVIAVIPARYRSTRFPGKPLSDIQGKPMIARVYEAVAKCSIFDWITVATDDERISEVCDSNNSS